jgi:signal transduction histidine kinase
MGKETTHEMQPTNDAVLTNGAGNVHPEVLNAALTNFGSTSPASRGEKLADVAHDARNMVTALACYCDLLEAPGVLAEPYRHYGNELKLVAAASRRLIDKLLELDGTENGLKCQTDSEDEGISFNDGGVALSQAGAKAVPTSGFTPKLVQDFAWEVQMNRNLLAALAGPSIALVVDTATGSLPVQMTCEDLTRILVNLVKNAVEAMPTGGRIRITTREIPTAPGESTRVVLNVEDNGPGIPSLALEKIFEPGYTTRTAESDGYGAWNPQHHGLGLAITRSIVEAAGGTIHAANRDPLGTCFQIELPTRLA